MNLGGRSGWPGWALFSLLLTYNCWASQLPASLWVQQGNDRYQSANQTDLLQAATTLCPQPVADSRPQRMLTGTGAEEVLWFGNEQGNLRWWRQASPGTVSTLWHQQQSVVLADRWTERIALVPDVSSAPVVTGERPPASAAASSALQVIWHDPQLPGLRSADLTDPAAPKPLWQVPALSTAFSAASDGADTSLQVSQPPVWHPWRYSGRMGAMLFRTAGAGAAQPVLQLIQVADGAEYAAINLRTLVDAVAVADLVAAPAVLDRDLDGQPDVILLVDRLGRVFRLRLRADPASVTAVQASAEWVADLSDSGADFSYPLLASRALLPLGQNPTQEPDHSSGQDRPVTPGQTAGAAATAGGSSYGQQGEVLVLLSKKAGQYQLWQLNLPDHMTQVIDAAQLTQRSAFVGDQAGTPLAGPVGNLSTDLPAPTTAANVGGTDQGHANATIAPALRSGWFSSLPAVPAAMPDVYAGVIYLPMQPSDQPSARCGQTRQADSLWIRHLFQGTPVYPATTLPSPQFSAFTEVAVQADGTLQLQDQLSGHTLLTPLQGIGTECRFCVRPLLRETAPVLKRLGSYQDESGVYR